MSRGLDANLKILVQLNQFRKHINSQSQQAQTVWKKVHSTYCFMYANATKDTIKELEKTLTTQYRLFKATYIKEQKTDTYIPEELLVLIFSQVGLKEILSLRLACKDFCRITHGNDVQRNIIVRETGLTLLSSDEALKTHGKLSRAIRSSTREESVLYKSLYCSAPDLKFSKDHFILTDSKESIFLYDLKTKEKLSCLTNVSHRKAKIFGNDLYILTTDERVQRWDLPSRTMQWTSDRFNSAISYDEFDVEGDFIYLYSLFDLLKIDRKSNTLVDEFSLNTILLQPFFTGNGWALEYSLIDLSKIRIKYPCDESLAESFGCIPKLIQDNILYTVVKNTNTLKIFDLKSMNLTHTIKTTLKWDGIRKFAQDNGFLYVCDNTCIVVIDLLTKKQISSINIANIRNLWVHVDTLFFRATIDTISYITFSENSASKNPVQHFLNLFSIQS